MRKLDRATKKGIFKPNEHVSEEHPSRLKVPILVRVVKEDLAIRGSITNELLEQENNLVALEE